ncbi:MAG: tellurium resistance protein [Rhodobacteraceae bacterium]|uniref:ADP-ribose pyrophosphatase n=1 Tax=Salipiger profundus TaxID=1229727 RepID=A0A1U7DAA6_9RHOB|nr:MULTISPECIES: NUDIX domain-containing protein [Salipiger]APX25069.1 protein containing C-terminal region of TrgB protein [Salipiger profundus]MAB07576.1 tellurium resistance protein [Paracoccaceae bacterium]GGA15165.1 tellurite resistance protein [Salipiger profundus]SFD11528.1 nudix-type nucleoside diphosphatase, YffH/AdpP family [Salipiger profundus]
MPNLFLFGTLCHPPLLEIVFGRPVEARPATLTDHAVVTLPDRAVPATALRAVPGEQAPGVFLRDLPNEDLARLEYYLGGFDNGLREMTVSVEGTSRSAMVACRKATPEHGDGPFDPEAWARGWAVLACQAAREIMAQFGSTDLETMNQLRPFVTSRAWAQQLAQDGAPHELRSDRGLDTVEIVRERPGFEGFFRLRAFDLRHRRFDGTMSETISREGFIAYDAALVLPYDPATDRVLLIEQLRYGPVLRGDPFPLVLEPAAGLIDSGETPETCALREAEEEAGLKLRELRPMVKIYASPGYTTEFFHCFLGLCDLSEDDNGLAGLDEEHEDIRNHVISFDRAMELIDSGEINVGPLVMMLFWLARHREELRRNA